jgi:hypothetical protein
VDEPGRQWWVRDERMHWQRPFYSLVIDRIDTSDTALYECRVDIDERRQDIVYRDKPIRLVVIGELIWIRVLFKILQQHVLERPIAVTKPVLLSVSSHSATIEWKHNRNIGMNRYLLEIR